MPAASPARARSADYPLLEPTARPRRAGSGGDPRGRRVGRARGGPGGGDGRCAALRGCRSAPLCTRCSRSTNADGRPTPSIIWADTRAAAQAERLRADPIGLGAAPAHGHARASDVAADEARVVPRAGPGDLSRPRRKWVGIKDYLFHQLTGECVMDHSCASGTGLMELSSARLGRGGAGGRRDRCRPAARAGAEHARVEAQRRRCRASSGSPRGRRSSPAAATGRSRTWVSARFAPASRRARSGRAGRSGSSSRSRPSIRGAACSATP